MPQISQASEAAQATIVFFPEGAYGPTNNCVGIGDVLRRRGHRVVFIIEESFAGTLEEKGFEERLMRLAPVSQAEEDPGQFWKDFIRETAPVFRTPTIEQLEGFIAPTFQALIDGARHVDERLIEIFDELRPDVIVEDNVVSFPALMACGRPWVRIVSCNPAELARRAGAPHLLRLSDRRSQPLGRLPRGVRAHARRHARRLRRVLPRARGAAVAGPRVHARVTLAQPVALSRGDRLRPRLSARIRLAQPRGERPGDRRPWTMPRSLSDGDEPLVYLSLGSLASGDVELMQGLIDSLADAPFRVIVSMGPQHESLELAGNMAGAEFLPQASILPQVDLVITHGGNNTVTESLYYGKPMVVLPVFWDQHDNAQRIHETGFGVRLDTYGHEPAELPAAVEGLLSDAALGPRLATVSRRLQDSPGTVRAADLIEQVALTGDSTRL